MPQPRFGASLCVLALLAFGGGTAAYRRSGSPARTGSYNDLVSLFHDWRTFQKPKVQDDVPDYTAAAMAAQQKGLAGYRQRLAAIDPSGWPVAQQVDYHLVQAEMNGLDFDLRVKRPWARSPSFYIMFYPTRSDQPLREGAHVEGSIEMYTYEPLTGEHVTALGAQLRAIPAIMEQAKINLTANCRDLWVLGIREMKQQSQDLDEFAKTMAETNPTLVPDVQRAKTATDQFVTWLEAELPKKTGPSGIGKDNYTWYLHNVQLVPYTWSDELAMLQTELARADAAIELEAFHNRDVPALEPTRNQQEYTPRFDRAVSEFMQGLRDRDVLTIKDYMEPALRLRNHYTPIDQFEFFNQVNARDPIIMLSHDFHWFDLAQKQYDPNPSPIRRETLLYSIFDTRTEGFASAFEEMNLEAGLFDKHPHVRELVYAIVAERCAVALGDLLMASNDLTIDQAVKLASERTPHGWLSTTSKNVWGADGEGLYITQPTYGTSYTIGKIEILDLMGARARQQGAAFTVKGFYDDFTSRGLIPVSLIRWDMTGQDDQIKKMAANQ